jgi:hypothetical protein
MRTIFAPSDLQDLRRRLAELTPRSERRWGRMTPHQSVCHLNDWFKALLGDRPIPGREPGLGIKILRFIAFNTPVPWLRGFPTSPMQDQEKNGTPPAEFAADVSELDRARHGVKRIRPLPRVDAELARPRRVEREHAWARDGQQPADVLRGHEMPGRPEHVRPHDAGRVDGPVDRRVRRALDPQGGLGSRRSSGSVQGRRRPFQPKRLSCSRSDSGPWKSPTPNM